MIYPFSISPSLIKVKSIPEEMASSSSSGEGGDLPTQRRVIAPGTLRTPHFTQITDPVDTINPVTGRSFYFGARPWRCTDRVMDLSSSISSWDGPSALRRQWKLFRSCASSEPGDEPVDNYYRLTRVDAMYFRDRHVNNMIRYKFFERYPFRGEDLTRVSENDTVRMRTWRYQRLLEKEVESGQAVVSTGGLSSRNEIYNKNAPNEVVAGLQSSAGVPGAQKAGEVHSHSNLPKDLFERNKQKTQQVQEQNVVHAAPPMTGQDDMSDKERKYYEMRSFLQRQQQLEKEKEEIKREGAAGAESSIMKSMPWFGKNKGQ